MASRVKPGVRKLFLSVLLIAGLVGGYFAADHYGYIPQRLSRQSAVPKAANLPTFTPNQPNQSSTAPVALASFPSQSAARISNPEIRMQIWAWNQQQGLLLANGGLTTTKGSIMEKHGVKLSFERQDWPDKMREALASFATDLASGNSQPTTGVHFVNIMGDGAAAFLAALNKQLSRLGPQYTAVIVGSSGRSFGEDKFMAPPEVKLDPQKARGLLIAGVIKDGDWNIAQKWAHDNGIPNNSDDRTYDADAINWINTPGYIEAGDAYISNTCEDRPIVHKGIKTGAAYHACVKGVVTWTPGDVNVVEKKGGLVSVASTKEYSGQMPSTIIGIKAWCQQNSHSVEEMLAAMFEGADQIRYYPEALDKGSEISAVVYGEQNAAYWKKYYNGAWLTDRQGNKVPCGGSLVHNLADNLRLFGLEQGASRPSPFEATYTTFGDIVKDQYPQDVPSYPSVDDVLDTTYLQALAARSQITAPVETATFSAQKSITSVVSRRSWHIQFNTNADTFTNEAVQQLYGLLKDIQITDLYVLVTGHTDNTGDHQWNMELSHRRAMAVQAWLQSHGQFRENQIKIEWKGDTQPVEDNTTDAGRAQNRRVDITFGTSN